MIRKKTTKLEKKPLETDFEKLDGLFLYKYKEDLYDKIKELGFKHVSEFVWDEYYINKLSISQISRKLGMAKTAIRTWMVRWDYERRPLGGNVKNPKLHDPAFVADIIKAKGTMTSVTAIKTFDCSYNSIRKIWRNAA